MSITFQVIIKYSSFLLLVVLTSACSRMFDYQVNFRLDEPLRVAVMPFVRIDAEGEIVNDDGKLLIDSINPLAGEIDVEPAEYLRQLVQRELFRTGWDILSGALIDVELPHHGYAFVDTGKFDLRKIYEATPKELCTHFVSCDAVLYGRVLKWERAYYAVQTVNTISLELKLVSARTGQVLYESRITDSESRGLSKGPTGFSDLVLEPIRGLDADIIKELAESVVKDSLEPLFVETRPEYLNVEAPVIFATSHDAVGGLLTRKDRLLVLAYGSPAATASFSIGNVILNVPMLEKSPGHYIGEYYPISTDNFSNQPVVVSLSDQYKRETLQTVAKSLVSIK